MKSFTVLNIALRAFTSLQLSQSHSLTILYAKNSSYLFCQNITHLVVNVTISLWRFCLGGGFYPFCQIYWAGGFCPCQQKRVGGDSVWGGYGGICPTRLQYSGTYKCKIKLQFVNTLKKMTIVRNVLGRKLFYI